MVRVRASRFKYTHVQGACPQRPDRREARSTRASAPRPGRRAERDRVARREALCALNHSRETRAPSGRADYLAAPADTPPCGIRPRARTAKAASGPGRRSA